MSGGGHGEQPSEQGSRDVKSSCDVIDALERRLRCEEIEESKSWSMPSGGGSEGGRRPPSEFPGGGPGRGPSRPRGGGSEGGRNPLPGLQGWISPSRMAWRTRPAVSWMSSL